MVTGADVAGAVVCTVGAVVGDVVVPGSMWGMSPGEIVAAVVVTVIVVTGGSVEGVVTVGFLLSDQGVNVAGAAPAAAAAAPTAITPAAIPYPALTKPFIVFLLR